MTHFAGFNWSDFCALAMDKPNAAVVHENLPMQIEDSDGSLRWINVQIVRPAGYTLALADYRAIEREAQEGK